MILGKNHEKIDIFRLSIQPEIIIYLQMSQGQPLQNITVKLFENALESMRGLML